jgi:hypothetical protein
MIACDRLLYFPSTQGIETVASLAEIPAAASSYVTFDLIVED